MGERNDTADVLAELLATHAATAATLRAWWDAAHAARSQHAHPIDRALLGGALADRLGFAFASGYAEALRVLVPSLDGIAALCATEAQGNHPRAIRTALAPAGPGRYTLTGRKTWVTVASEASTLLVVASAGEDPAGRNRLRVARIAASAPNVRLHPAPPIPFVPEIAHAEVELAGVAVDESALLPGDGYDDYLKPFRTIEDLHVHAALVGYLIGVARRHRLPAASVEALLAIAAATRTLATASPKQGTTHLALAGLLDLVTGVLANVERTWSSVAGSASASDAARAEWQRWQRDRPLLQVASKARGARRDTARAAAGLAHATT